jgi:hypothetical protein
MIKKQLIKLYKLIVYFLKYFRNESKENEID